MEEERSDSEEGFSTTTNRRVHVVASWAPLLSGELGSCISANDTSCSGGVAAVRAFLRHYQNEQDNDSSLLLQWLDLSHNFINMHPLGWSVNRLVLNDLMGLDAFMYIPSILLQNKVDSNVSTTDLSNLQTLKMPLLLTNVAIPPKNSWYPYVEGIRFDVRTGLAVMHISSTGHPLAVPQIESARGRLDFIARLNQEKVECVYQNSSTVSLYQSYSNTFRNQTTSTVGETETCWTPVVLVHDVYENSVNFIEAVLNNKFENPPGLLIHSWSPALEMYKTPQRVGRAGTWVVSCQNDDDMYNQFTLHIDKTTGNIENVTTVIHPLDPLPEDMRDSVYANEITQLHKLAEQAQRNDPVVGYTGYMPFSLRNTLQPCKGGECPLGNLFTDALRWKEDADFAFMRAGGLQGPGWDAGEVKMSDLFKAFIYSNTQCTGYMSGVSMFKLLNYSTSMATFQTEDTPTGGDLLQVSGVKITYNSLLNTSRLVSVSVFDREQERYLPLERLRMYKFVTDSFLCTAKVPFSGLLGKLTMEGEQSGVLGYDLIQKIVSDYLSQFPQDSPYNTTVNGRLVNNTSIFQSLNLIETEDTCAAGTFWLRSVESCLTCPSSVSAAFDKQQVEFASRSSSEVISKGMIGLFNLDDIPVAVFPKEIPDWITFGNAFSVTNATVNIPPKDHIHIEFLVNSTSLEEGTAQATVAFGVLDGGNYPGCLGKDATFDVLMRVFPEENFNYLGNIRIAGFTLVAIVVCTSAFFAFYVYYHRKQRVVKTLQPIFLLTICIGILVLGTAIIPLSIDDEMVSARACDAACMAVPWLLSMGFTIAMSALFSKLWRINKLFARSFRKRKVRARDVMLPITILLTLNLVCLLIWTLVDPLVWKRQPVEDKTAWNTYGRCSTNGTVSITMLVLVSLVNVLALVLAIYQAWRAHKISDEFSESRNMGMALFSWAQIFLVGFPVLFLIDNDNPTAKYFIEIALIFAVSMSMLLILFVPIMIHLHKPQNGGDGRSRQSCELSWGRGGIHVSGLNNNMNGSPIGSDNTLIPSAVFNTPHRENLGAKDNSEGRGTNTDDAVIATEEGNNEGPECNTDEEPLQIPG